MTGTTAAIAIIAIVGGLLYSAYELNINAKLKDKMQTTTMICKKN
ncbi:hypothetical protein RT723_09210 [Psychrosphaera aquimarina]|uniref:Uncharacterized protein n=1 Tax=Psychrosphaera aquimarina TaxID=2044854 RepID=A0ABU3R0F5_9GAMM|nr:hypothetical protein [Psychrosphaera aquimarina]MDU0113171.1 hypothetical protein [Psychrosphaera aquimarina]